MLTSNHSTSLSKTKQCLDILNSIQLLDSSQFSRIYQVRVTTLYDRGISVDKAHCTYTHLSCNFRAKTSVILLSSIFLAKFCSSSLPIRVADSMAFCSFWCFVCVHCVPSLRTPMEISCYKAFWAILGTLQLFYYLCFRYQCIIIVIFILFVFFMCFICAI